MFKNIKSISGLICLALFASISVIRAEFYISDRDLESMRMTREEFEIEHAKLVAYSNSEEGRLEQLRFNTPDPIPGQAWDSDIVGVGRVVGAGNTPIDDWSKGFVDIEIDTFWRGDPGTNTFRIPMKKLDNQPPVTNAPMVFFMVKYGFWRRVNKANDEDFWKYYRFIDMDYIRSVETANGLWLGSDSRSWFYADGENAELTAFASNLVYAVDSCNTNAFYKLIRDGVNNYPLGHRIHDDSYVELINPEQYFRLEFIEKVIWKDTKLPEKVKHDIASMMMNWHQIYLPWGDETVIIAR